MNMKLKKQSGAYSAPALVECKCTIERGFAGSTDFDDLDFDKRDEE